MSDHTDSEQLLEENVKGTTFIRSCDSNFRIHIPKHVRTNTVMHLVRNLNNFSTIVSLSTH